VHHAVEILLCQGLGPNPYQPTDLPDPEPFTRAEIVAEIRKQFGDLAAKSLRLPVH